MLPTIDLSNKILHVVRECRRMFALNKQGLSALERSCRGSFPKGGFATACVALVLRRICPWRCYRWCVVAVEAHCEAALL